MRQNTLDNISLIFFKIDGIFVGIPKKIPTKRRNMIGHVANFMTKISLFRQYYTNRSLLFLQKAAIGGFWKDVVTECLFIRIVKNGVKQGSNDTTRILLPHEQQLIIFTKLL